MLWSNKAPVPQLLSLCSRAQELQLWSPRVTSNQHLPCQEAALLPQKIKGSSQNNTQSNAPRVPFGCTISYQALHPN